MKRYNSIDIFKIKKALQIRGYKISKKNKLISENFKYAPCVLQVRRYRGS